MKNYDNLDISKIDDLLMFLGHWDVHLDEQMTVGAFANLSINLNEDKEFIANINQLPQYAQEILKDQIFRKAYHTNNLKELRDFENLEGLPIGGAFVLDRYEFVQLVLTFVRDNYGGFARIWTDLDKLQEEKGQKTKNHIYTWEEFYQKVMGSNTVEKHTMRAFQSKLKRSSYWENEIKPIIVKSRITRLSCRPSFIHEYRKYITKTFSD